MATTTNYGWTTPDNTDAVANGALAIRTLGSAVDTSLKTVADSIRSIWRSGRVYRNGYYASTTYAQPGSNQTVAYVPFYVPNTVTLASVSVYVGDTATATSKLAIYNSDSATFKPTTLVVNLGTFSGSTVGAKTISTTQVLNAGLYWFALQLNQVTSYSVYAATNDFTDEFIMGLDSVSDAFTKTRAIGSYRAVDSSFPVANATSLTYVADDSAPLIAVAVA